MNEIAIAEIPRWLTCMGVCACNLDVGPGISLVTCLLKEKAFEKNCFSIHPGSQCLHDATQSLCNETAEISHGITCSLNLIESFYIPPHSIHN